MKMIRQSIIALGLTAVIFCMTSCGKQTNMETSKESYVANFFDMPDTVTGISRLLIKEDIVYLCCSEENGSTYLAAMTVDQGDFQKLPLEIGTSVSLLDFCFDRNGGIWTVCMEDTDNYNLKKFDENGRLIQTVDLVEVLDDSTASVAPRDLFLSIDSEDNICIAEKNGNTLVYMFDNKGQFLFSLHYDGNLMTTLATAEGRNGICSSSANRMNYELLTVDMKNKNWSKDKIYLGAAAGLYGGISNNFYRFDGSSLYRYPIGTQEGSCLFKWPDVGLSASDVHLGELSDGRLIVAAASPDQTGVFSYEMAVLSQGVDERTVLNMVSLTASPGIIQAVSDFNKINSQYKIELTEYFPYEQNVSNEEWDNAILNLNTRILSGNIPDILDMSDLPVQIYHSKGLLEDLYPYMERDEAFHMDEYFENVFQAISMEGELPYLTDGVAVSTMLGNAEIVDESAGWTLQCFENVLNTCGTNSIGNLSGKFFLKMMLQTDNSYLDWTTGKCTFDSPEFVKLLEFAAKIQESSQSPAAGEESGSYAAVYQAVLSIYHITQYRDYFHGNLKLLGLPSSNGEYHAVIPEVKIGISSAGKHKDGAWQFVRTLLTEDHQKSCTMLPFHKGAFETVMQAAIEGDSVWRWLYDNGNAAKEDVELVRELLSSAAYVVNDNQTLETIVLEEAQEYFSGSGSAKEAAERIQNRVSLYMNEQM